MTLFTLSCVLFVFGSHSWVLFTLRCALCLVRNVCPSSHWAVFCLRLVHSVWPCLHWSVWFTERSCSHWAVCCLFGSHLCCSHDILFLFSSHCLATELCSVCVWFTLRCVLFDSQCLTVSQEVVSFAFGSQICSPRCFTLQLTTS